MNRQSLASLLLATDRLASPLLEIGAATARAGYTPYGYRPPGMQSHTGFTGQLREPELGWYMLGNGHRVYNPILMRFHSRDQLSPFGKGGINCYAYCKCDPVNTLDPTGQVPAVLSPLIGLLTNSLSGLSSYFSLRNLFRTRRAEAPARRASNADLADNRVITTRRRDIAVSVLSASTAVLGGGTSVMRMADPDLGDPAMYIGFASTAITLGTTAWEIYQQSQKRPWDQGPELMQADRTSSPQPAAFIEMQDQVLQPPQLSHASDLSQVATVNVLVRSGGLEETFV